MFQSFQWDILGVFNCQQFFSQSTWHQFYANALHIKHWKSRPIKTNVGLEADTIPHNNAYSFLSNMENTLNKMNMEINFFACARFQPIRLVGKPLTPLWMQDEIRHPRQFVRLNARMSGTAFETWAVLVCIAVWWFCEKFAKAVLLLFYSWRF